MDGMCIDKASWQSTVDEKVKAPELTKQDFAFEAENCQFVWGLQDLTVSDLNALFQKVYQQLHQQLQTILVCSLFAVSTWEV